MHNPHILPKWYDRFTEPWFDLMLNLTRTSLILCGLAAATLLEPALSWAQQPKNPRGGLIPNLPLIPEFPTRPLESNDEPFRETPTEAESKPTASFIDSIKVNDAAIEVVLGQGRLITLAAPLANENGVPVIAVANPGIVDFEILPDQRLIRLVAKSIGVTDLSFVGADGQSYSFEIHVTYDTVLLRTQLKQIFPTADIQLKQLREHLIVEGQATSAEQVHQILNTIEAYLSSIQVNNAPTLRNTVSTSGSGTAGSGSTETSATLSDQDAGDQTVGDPDASSEGDNTTTASGPFAAPTQRGFTMEMGERESSTASLTRPQLINLLKVPGSQQVMLKVTVAEVNRTALREIGVNLNISDYFENTVIGSGNAKITFGSDATLLMKALRTNSIATILAEPTLVTLSGFPAQFQSGGEFPVPQSSQFGGFGGTTFKDFGVQLSFTPLIQENGTIRLTVSPEVSNVDKSLSVAVIAGGDSVPGVRTRNTSTTVEMTQGQTLAIAGLLNRETAGTTSRFPVLGDLPIIGPFFGTTAHQVPTELELMVTVTPYIVDALDDESCLPLPGGDVMEPNDLEVFLMNRISGRTGEPHRSTTNWDDPLGRIRQQRLEKKNVYGPFGFAR